MGAFSEPLDEQNHAYSSFWPFFPLSFLPPAAGVRPATLAALGLSPRRRPIERSQSAPHVHKEGDRRRGRGRRRHV